MRTGAPTVPFEQRGAAVDREFRLAIEDHEHLLGGVVEMVAHAPTGCDLTAMQEIQVGLQGRPGQQRHAVHVADAAMRAPWAVAAGIVMTHSLG
jgi:hypothetical protein